MPIPGTLLCMLKSVFNLLSAGEQLYQLNITLTLNTEKFGRVTVLLKGENAVRIGLCSLAGNTQRLSRSLWAECWTEGEQKEICSTTEVMSGQKKTTFKTKVDSESSFEIISSITGEEISRKGKEVRRLAMARLWDNLPSRRNTQQCFGQRLQNS